MSLTQKITTRIRGQQARHRPPVVDSALRRTLVGVTQLVAGASLLAPAVGYISNAIALLVGASSSRAIEVGWLVAILGLPAAGACGLMLLASRPPPVPPGDLSSPADRWPL